jgi:uncharacterized membrane protein (UPF0127 family)
VNTRDSNRLFVYNKTRETFLATEAKVADGYFSRLVGLLGKTQRWARAGQGLWIVPSHGVHTIGMLFALDLVFLDRDLRVVHIEEYVRPFRISRVSLKAQSVLRGVASGDPKGAHDEAHDQGLGPPAFWIVLLSAERFLRKGSAGLLHGTAGGCAERISAGRAAAL